MSPFSHSCHGKSQFWQDNHLEKVCGVEKGTKPIIYDKEGKLSESLANALSYIYILFLLGRKLEPCETHLIPSVEAS